MAVNALIVGGGAFGAAVAGMLVDGGHDVTVLEVDASRVEGLRESLTAVKFHVGTGTDPAHLEAAGARRTDVLVALTGSDEVNLLVTSLGRFEFEVPRTIARVVDPGHAWLFDEVMGVDVALDQARLLAHLVAEELSLGSMTTLLKLRRGQFELVEERVHPHAAAVGRRPSELALPATCVLVAVLREGTPTVAGDDAVLCAGDEVLAVVHSGEAAALARLLGPPET